MCSAPALRQRRIVGAGHICSLYVPIMPHWMHLTRDHLRPIHIGIGGRAAIVWTGEPTHDYVSINADCGS